MVPNCHQTLKFYLGIYMYDMHVACTCRQDRDIQEPEVIYEASDEEDDNEPVPRLQLLASDSER